MKFFGSDQHYEHDNVLTKLHRLGYDTQEEHDAVVIDEINDRVNPTDELYLLGDVAWKNPGKLRQQIRCKNVRFVIGNHDKIGKCTNVFGEIYQRMDVKLSNGVIAVCDHYPIAYWNKCHYGSYHLYGHMHMQREFTLNSLFPGRRSMDVGVDNALRILGRPAPFSELEIIELLSSKPGHDPVEFYQDRQVMLEMFSMLPDTDRFGTWKGRSYREWLGL